jgi:hypothetical protein
MLERSRSPCLDVGKSITNASESRLAFLVALVFDVPMSEGFIERKFGSPICELGLDKPLEGP